MLRGNGASSSSTSQEPRGDEQAEFKESRTGVRRFNRGLTGERAVVISTRGRKDGGWIRGPRRKAPFDGDGGSASDRPTKRAKLRQNEASVRTI